MFIDYYQILNVPQNASFDEIKKAYRLMSAKWHPDKNPNRDTTQIMQDINEAYYILKDTQKRQRYDEEYKHFKREFNSYQSSYSYDYGVKDEQVKQDIHQARNYAKEFTDEFKNSMSRATKAAWQEISSLFIGVLLVSIIFFLIRACVG